LQLNHAICNSAVPNLASTVALNLPVDIDRILAAGGKQRIALLRLCVMSVQMEPVFVFLTQEYRLRPTHDAALALYDVFCAPDAPARIEARDMLAPRDLGLVSAIRSIRQQRDQMRQPEQGEPESGIPITTPHRHLFDGIARALQDAPSGSYARLGSEFDPRLSPEQNLPGGRMSAAQRHFVNYVWRTIARPRLVEAGFWRIADIE
jgi:hypothetical protein